ncbi:S41 family peptidase [Niveibacterium sp. 24ML]|uniref:S41 family peptidase n=1 Tax=Niveibacterium sp. 24ML TaxID=2985512 RepID=UPI0022705E97|nr:S41 family peptidase [Niveibacterium sp. 24ML]MCX9155618.1 S41 family peptidase [Niveibacterium sp. 24ML]
MLNPAPGSSSGGGVGSSGSPAPTPAPAGFPPSSSLAAQCIAPRTGTDPETGRPYVDRAGSAVTEKAWLRSWINETYLWYREVPDPNPSAFATVLAYFDVLKTPALTPSGKPKDQFHFTYSTEEWIRQSESGITAGYGAELSFGSSTPPRSIRVAYVQPGSPAELAGLRRGTEFITADGENIADSANVDLLNAALFPEEEGESHTFTVRDAGVERSVTMSSAAVKLSAVMNTRTLSTASGKVGYIQFNDHIAPAEADLVKAVEQLRGEAVTDLVLDLRYNGGGYLAIASQMAYMIAGPDRTAGKFFERTMFNDKHTSTNPVTGRPLAATPFYASSLGFSLAEGQALPTLGLGRVYVLTGGGTCSASEAIINGLRGAGIQVFQIGNTTCGKPYGFYPQDNCGTTYFAIQFKGVNAAGFGDYADGFVPAGSGEAGVPGCVVADDFAHELGDPAEARLAAALSYRDTGICPPQPAARALAPTRAGLPIGAGVWTRSPFRDNRILQR